MAGREFPDFARRGVPIEVTNPQPHVRENAEKAKDWPYADEARYLYARAVLFRERLIDPIARIDRSQMPDPVISFENLRNKHTLAAYRLTRNPQGLNYEIIFNTQQYEDVEVDGKIKKVWKYGEWALNETEAHELVHEWQQTVGQDPIQLGNVYHNREFVDKCETIGLHPKLGEGYHLQLADGPFAVLMKELGIQPPDLTEASGEFDIDWFKWWLKTQGKDKKGSSTLKKWTCPECGLNARIGIKGDPRIVHDPCSEVKGEKVFIVQHDGTTHQIYEFPYSGKSHNQEVKLVTQAYQTMISIDAKDQNADNYERLEKLREKTQERLYRRLDALTGRS